MIIAGGNIELRNKRCTYCHWEEELDENVKVTGWTEIPSTTASDGESIGVE